MKTQPHRIISLIVFCLLLMSCNTKEKTESPNLIINPSKKVDIEKLNVKTTEVFDLKIFKDKQKDNLYEYDTNDTVIRLSENEQYYKKELIVDNSFTQTFEYDKTTKSLIRKSSAFLGMPIGVWSTYDENGTLIQQENYDEGFDFTVTDLIALLKKELQIDLINDEHYGFAISRHFDKNFYFIDSYYYLIKMSDAGGTRTITIDGGTGKILTDESSFYEE